MFRWLQRYVKGEVDGIHLAVILGAVQDGEDLLLIGVTYHFNNICRSES